MYRIVVIKRMLSIANELFPKENGNNLPTNVLKIRCGFEFQIKVLLFGFCSMSQKAHDIYSYLQEKCIELAYLFWWNYFEVHTHKKSTQNAKILIEQTNIL